jgi:hypothetical protein
LKEELRKNRANYGKERGERQPVLLGRLLHRNPREFAGYTFGSEHCAATVIKHCILAVTALVCCRETVRNREEITIA